MKKRRQMDWVIGSLRTLAALAGVLLLAFGAAPGALAAGTQQAAQAPAGETGTVIWGVVFALAALGIITAEIAQKKRAARRDSKFFVVLTVYQNIQLYIFIIAMLFMLLFFLAPGFLLTHFYTYYIINFEYE